MGVNRGKDRMWGAMNDDYRSQAERRRLENVIAGLECQTRENRSTSVGVVVTDERAIIAIRRFRAAASIGNVETGFEFHDIRASLKQIDTMITGHLGDRRI